MNKLLTATVLVATAAGACAWAATPQAQTPLTQEQALTRLFSAPEAREGWFTPEFLQQAPLRPSTANS